MPAGGSRPDLLVDTSVAVALVLEAHEWHPSFVAHLRGARLGLAGHAAFETYSVLTRLPPPARLGGPAASALLLANFPGTAFLDAERTAELLRSLPALGITGGAVYDALVGATAAAHGRTLVTADRRAEVTYRALDVDVRFVG